MPRFVVNSEFFLDVLEWRLVDRDVIGPALGHGRSVRIWSAGCQAGKEPYSAAIMLEERGSAADAYILATDIDPAALASGRDGGPFPDAAIRRLTPAQRTRFLVPGGPPWFVSSELRDLVTFACHNLIRDPYEDAFDLVLFRNVEPFFVDEIKRKVQHALVRSLRPGGALFVGATDTVPEWRDLGLRRVSECVYVRP